MRSSYNVRDMTKSDMDVVTMRGMRQNLDVITICVIYLYKFLDIFLFERVIFSKLLL